jgi:hypothetical protein
LSNLARGKKEVNQFAWKVALILLTVSACAEQSDKKQDRRGDSITGGLHQPGPGNPDSSPDGKNGSGKLPEEKQENHPSQSINPASDKPLRPGSGSYNRELIH